jgi:hypothetical protein
MIISKWKIGKDEVVGAQFELLYRYIPGQPDVNNEKPQSG